MTRVPGQHCRPAERQIPIEIECIRLLHERLLVTGHVYRREVASDVVEVPLYPRKLELGKDLVPEYFPVLVQHALVYALEPVPHDSRVAHDVAVGDLLEEIVELGLFELSLSDQ